MKHKILVVDDDIDNLAPTKELLEMWGYSVDAVTSGEEGLSLLKNIFIEYSAVLLDYRMPRGMNGLVTAFEMKKIDPSCMIVMYSCEEDRGILKDSFKNGAIDFIDKNEPLERLKIAMEDACKRYEEIRLLRPSKDAGANQAILGSIGMVGRSEKMTSCAKTAIKYGGIPLPALIIGPTGSGKEKIAAAMHKDKNAPYIVLNCASLAPSLLESELFGYDKGAFTGANQGKPGIFESAKYGTVFLDELHQLDKKGQAALLRAIREGKIRRVGSNGEENPIHCRIIAAAQPHIKQMVKDETFLKDLYYRFNLTLEVPPLRDRKEDIELLVDYFCKEYAETMGVKKNFTARTVRYLEEYHWPGNVGELRGYVFQLIALSTKDIIEPRMLDERFNTGCELVAPKSGGLTTLSDLDLKQEQERREFIANALRLAQSQRHAADRLGIKESTLRNHIRDLKIRA